MIISVIGSGGKTTYIRELKDKYVSMNKTVLMCTTTHMLIEEDTLVDPGYDEIMQRIEIKTNAAPPYCPTIYGKRQTLPIPIAHPALIKINPKRFENLSLIFPTPYKNNLNILYIYLSKASFFRNNV